MIGGVVVEVCNVPSRNDVLFVEVVDWQAFKNRRCGVLCMNSSVSRRIQIGDELWWHRGYCYWTQQGEKSVKDLPIPKIGHSGLTFESVCRMEQDD